MTTTAPHPGPIQMRAAGVASRSSGPLGAFTEGLRIGGLPVPVPLVSTTIGVAVRGALATVTTVRRFRNAEATSIEATLTYPVPVDAVAHGLVVRIAGRTLVGVAHAKDEARERYEQAMDDGRTAILHEEPLRGVHILSVGQIPPHTELEVETVWTKALTARGAEAVLAIPTTVGEVYGRLPLDPGDDLAADGPPATATMTVTIDSGRIVLCGTPIEPETARAVPLDRHIVVAFEGLTWTSIAGATADGRAVALSVRPCAGGDAPLDVVCLFDRSSSTLDAFDPAQGRAAGSVHAIAAEALQTAAARALRHGDRFALWQFDTTAEKIGAARGKDVPGLVSRLGAPRGGTEIGRSIETAMTAEGAPRDLLLVTDGRSGALDVQALAARGWRVSVVLCGPASLDALPGHLVALTGGQLMAVGGGGDGLAEVASAFEAVFRQLRHPRSPQGATGLNTLPQNLHARRGGMEIEATWSVDPAPGTSLDAVGAYAAALALPLLDRETATTVAIRHGLVTHLTSLLVVDADGPVQATIPTQRKVSLPEPAPSAPLAMAPPDRMYLREPAASPAASAAQPRMARIEDRQPPMAAPSTPRPEMPPTRPTGSRPRSAAPVKMFHLGETLSRVFRRAPTSKRPEAAQVPVPRLQSATASIDWRRDGPALAEGDLAWLDEWIRNAIMAAAARSDLIEAARRAGLSPIVLVVALMAATDTSERTRARIARRIAHLPAPDRLKLSKLVGL